MSKPFALQSLLDMAQSRTDAAAAALGVVNGHVRDMEQRLQMLHAYRQEYSDLLSRSARSGINSIGWQNFRLFLAHIDAAIVQQQALLDQARQRAQQSQSQWHAERRTLKSFDTLSQRHRTEEHRREARLEQKEQDSFALRSYLARALATG